MTQTRLRGSRQVIVVATSSEWALIVPLTASLRVHRRLGDLWRCATLAEGTALLGDAFAVGLERGCRSPLDQTVALAQASPG